MASSRNHAPILQEGKGTQLTLPAEARVTMDARRTSQGAYGKHILQHQSAWELIPEKHSVLFSFEEDSEVTEISNKVIVNKKTPKAPI